MKCPSAVYFLTAFTVYTVTVQASNKTDIQELKQRMICLEEKKTCCTQTRCERCSCDPDYDAAFNFSAEALYWKVSESGLTYAIKSGFDASSNFVKLQGARSKHPEFQWHWGFRVGAGYSTCYDLWDINASWTRLHFTTHRTTTLGPPRDAFVAGLPSIFPEWIPNIFLFAGPRSCNSAEARWQVHLDSFDLQVARQFYVTNYLTLKPHLGMRFAWIRQRYDLDFVELIIPMISNEAQRTFDIDMKNNFWGIGIVAGLDTGWELGSGFSIYGNAAISILDGHFADSTDYTATSLDGLGATLILGDFDDDSDQNMAVAIADLAIGLRWDTMFSCDRFHFAIWAGYEQHVFFEQNQFMNFQASLPFTGPLPLSETNGGNLNMTGVVMGVDFGF